MVKPAAFEASPVSPGSQRSWYSPRRLKKRVSAPNSMKSGGNPGSPGLDSVASFDPSVIEADRAARQHELEQLYAAALAQEAAKSQTYVATETELHPPDHSSSKDRRRLRLLTSAPALAHLDAGSNPVSPMTPRTPKSPVRAIYPPDSPMPQYPSSPTSPIRAEYPQAPLTPRYLSSPIRRPPSPVPAQKRASRASSFGSHSSAHEGQNRLRRSLRNLRITAPGSRYPGEQSDEDARTPLTPRYHQTAGGPSSPSARSDAPTTPGTHDGYRYSQGAEPGEAVDQIRALPRAAPQRPGSHQYQHAAQQGADGSASTLGSLPFRAMADPHAAAMAPLSSPAAPVTRVTYLERRRDMAMAPMTGLATPYSPYMPFTPLTPVTPHLTSRAERKQREKERGRRVLGAEDKVPEEDEIWGSGY
ncbi:hypothetical protein MBLNU459_g1074t3 [Dothideomycetes sp. NU459]